jgi:hypothetical protein
MTSKYLGILAKVSVWSVRFHALSLALGEPRLTVGESVPDRMRYAWDCGCHAITADNITCLVTACSQHEGLFPTQTALRESE